MTEYQFCTVWYGTPRRYVPHFISEDCEEAIKAMRDYCKKNGFTDTDAKGRNNTVENLVIREMTLTGKEVSCVPYFAFFDHFDRKRTQELKVKQHEKGYWYEVREE